MRPASAASPLPNSELLPGLARTALESIRDAGCNIAIWPRALPEPLASAADRFASLGLPNLRFACPAASLRAALGEALSEAGWQAEPVRDTWIEDMAMLGRVLAEVDGQETLHVRVETLRDDGCRRYHTDRVRLRMLCTYTGPGSQWLRDEHVSRAALSAGEPNAAIARGPAQQLETGWVALLKGDSYPGGTPAVVHRSPPLYGSGRHRVLLCLDNTAYSGCR